MCRIVVVPSVPLFPGFRPLHRSVLQRSVCPTTGRMEEHSSRGCPRSNPTIRPRMSVDTRSRHKLLKVGPITFGTNAHTILRLAARRSCDKKDEKLSPDDSSFSFHGCSRASATLDRRVGRRPLWRQFSIKFRRVSEAGNHVLMCTDQAIDCVEERNAEPNRLQEGRTQRG